MRLTGRGLACVRGGRTVFSGIDFSVGAGGALAVTGPNGSGKSSLLRLIAGLLRIESGSLSLTGGDPELTIAEQAHYLGHLDPVKPSLTVAENLTMWSGYLGGGAANGGLRAGIGAALERTGLGDLTDLPAGYLSAGQRRRLSIARLLAVPRPLWLLDEPTAPLDARGEQDFTGLMRVHLANGGLIIVATHSPLAGAETNELRMGFHAAA
jgi:heme exporter protein A